MESRTELSSTAELRERARRHVMDGPVTEGYDLDPKRVVSLLNEALATEWVCALRYSATFRRQGDQSRLRPRSSWSPPPRNSTMRTGSRSASCSSAASPTWTSGLADRSHAQYHAGTGLAEMITEDLVAERIAIDSYREMVQFLGDHDPTTRRLLEEILAVEEEHADDLADLLEQER